MPHQRRIQRRQHERRQTLDRLYAECPECLLLDALLTRLHSDDMRGSTIMSLLEPYALSKTEAERIFKLLV